MLPDVPVWLCDFVVLPELSPQTSRILMLKNVAFWKTSRHCGNDSTVKDTFAIRTHQFGVEVWCTPVYDVRNARENGHKKGTRQLVLSAIVQNVRTAERKRKGKKRSWQNEKRWERRAEKTTREAEWKVNAIIKMV